MSKKAAKNTKSKKPIIIVVICIGLIVTAGVCVTIKSMADKVIANKTYNGIKARGLVNGEPFFQSDLEVYTAELRAAVANHYGRKYNLFGMGADFWKTEYDGQTPQEFLDQRALEDIARNMVMIQEARKQDIDTPATYHDLENERETWNTTTDDIVYGPKTLAPAEYNSYRIGGIEDALKTNLLKTTLAPTADQMRTAFNSLPNEFKMAPVVITGFRISWDENPTKDEQTRTSLIRAIREEGLSPEEAINRLRASVPGLVCVEYTNDSRYISKEDPYEQGLAMILSEANEGAVVTGPEKRPELFYVTKKEGGHVLTFEEAPGLGQNKWINDQFELFLDKKVKTAKIKLFNEIR